MMYFYIISTRLSFILAIFALISSSGCISSGGNTVSSQKSFTGYSPYSNTITNDTTPFTTTATLHSIIVADIDDTGIGADRDVAAMQKLTDTIRRTTSLSGQDIVITAGRGKSQQIQNTLNSLSVGPDDVVLFYYSGHGANPGGGDRWPTLGVEGQYGGNLLKLSSVKDILAAKSPRLLIAIADACNKIELGIVSLGRQEAEQAAGFRKLFLGYEGYIIASSSVPDQYSFGDSDRGGFFTNQLLEVLNEVQASSNPDWETVKAAATKEIVVNFPGQKTQSPQMKVNVTQITERKPDIIPYDDTWNRSQYDDPPNRSQSHYPRCADARYTREGNQDCCLDDNGRKQCFND